MQLAANTVVAGRFRLNQLIGRGGMGSVWQATHLGLDIPCAVKFLDGEMSQAPEAQTRFEREAKAAAQLRSPNVVQILDHGICDGTPYIAMELLEGEDLGKRLNRAVRLSPLELHPVVNQVCRALTKAHALGIVHRDLKPDNIFLVRDDDREIAKVLDFGIAKDHAQQLGVSSTTKTGAMLGTPYYMSPEQAQGTKQVDGRSDLWALAVICFRALTGKLPFTSEALGDLLMKIIIGPIPVPSQVGPVPEGFDRWWAKATQREPADRFQSPKDFADSLALVCGVSHVSGIIDRSNLRVVAHQPSGALPQAPANAPPTYAGPASAVATQAPLGHLGDTTKPPGTATPAPYPGAAAPQGQAAGYMPTPPPYGPPPVYGQQAPMGTPGMGQAPAPQPGGTPFGLSQVHSPPGTATPATFGESLGDLPKRTNVGIFVGMGAGVLVTLIAAVVFFLVHAPASGTTNGAGHTETTAGASATAAPPPTGSTAADTPTPAETASSPPPPASAVPSLAPDPVPPATAGVDSPTPGSLADSPKPPGDHPNLPTGTQPTAAPQDNPHPSTGHNDPGTSSHSQQHSAPRPTGTATGGRRPKHEDLGI